MSGGACLRPTPRLAASLAAVALVALLVPPALALAALVAVVAAAACDAVLVGDRRPEVLRRVPPFVVVGVPAEVAVEAPPGVTVEHPAAAGAAIAQGRLVANRRGRHELPSPLAEVDGPLRLVRWRGAVGRPASITAYPDVVAARRLARTAVATRFADEGGRRRGPLGLGTAFESLREYQPDDDVRLVNWRATARVGRPVVNQLRVEQSRDVLLLVDCGRLATTGVAGRQRLDVAVQAASAVALTADEVGDRCGLVAFADRRLAELPPRHGGGRNVVGVLATVDAQPVDADVEAALRAVPAKRSIVVVVTDLVDEATTRSLLWGLPVLGRRHELVVVAIDDPAVHGALAAAAGGRAAAARGAAAWELLAARDRVVALLRRHGAHVALAGPDRLADAACRAYLSAKLRSGG